VLQDFRPAGTILRRAPSCRMPSAIGTTSPAPTTSTPSQGRIRPICVCNWQGHEEIFQNGAADDKGGLIRFSSKFYTSLTLPTALEQDDENLMLVWVVRGVNEITGLQKHTQAFEVHGWEFSSKTTQARVFHAPHLAPIWPPHMHSRNIKRETQQLAAWIWWRRRTRGVL
jgi:hypothetical protein